MRTTPIPINPCPSCGAPTDAASGRHEQQPTAGDYSICFQCCHVAQFDADLRLVAVLPAAVPAYIAAEADRLRRFKGIQ